MPFKYLLCGLALSMLVLCGHAQLAGGYYEPSEVVSQSVSDVGIHLKVKGDTDSFTEGTLLKLKYRSHDNQTLEFIAFLCSKSGGGLFLRSIDSGNKKFPLSSMEKVLTVSVLGYNLDDRRRIELQKLCP